MFSEKNFELQRYINEPGLLFKFGFFKSFSADLVAKFPENCEVVKFQFPRNYPDILKYVLKYKRIVYHFFQIPKD